MAFAAALARKYFLVINCPRSPSSDPTPLRLSSDPYVELNVEGPNEYQTEGVTPPIPENGFNPKWQGEASPFEFHVTDPALTFLTLTVKDKKADVFLGNATVVVAALQTGYRVVPLQLRNGTPIPEAHLLVHLSFSTKTQDLRKGTQLRIPPPPSP